MPGQLGGAPTCPVCGQRVYFNEEKGFMGRSWHKKCFNCCNCSKSLESGTANLMEDESIFCNPCFRKLFSEADDSAPKQREEYINHDDVECCPRCGKRVFFAEQFLSLGRKWHKMCFTCVSCKKKLDSTSAADHDGELYCKACHTRNFGPKGYGFAGGAGTGLSMDTGRAHHVSKGNVPHTAQAYVAPVADKLKQLELDDHDGENGHNGNGNGGRAAVRSQVEGADYCPRCDGQVFLAEKRQAAGNCYHERCFSCYVCNKKLESGKLTEKDNEVFCKVCYGKKFGPKGYGFGGGAGALQMTT